MRYLELENISVGSDEYIFRSVRFFKSQNLYKLVSSNRPLSYTRARKILISSLSVTGLNYKNLCLHILRSGGYTSAAASENVSERLIKAHGRWRTSNNNGYIKDSIGKQMAIYKGLYSLTDGYIKDYICKQMLVSSNLGI